MLLPKLPVQSGIAGRQKLRFGETQACRSTIDPILRPFNLQVYADRSFIDRDDPWFAGGPKLRTIFFIAEGWLVPKTVKYQSKGIRIGYIELDFLAALVAVPRGGSFVSDHGARGSVRRNGLSQAQNLIGLSKHGGWKIEELVGFERARR